MMKNKYWKFIISLFIIHHLSFIIAPDSLRAQQQNWLWAKSGGGRGQDEVSAVAVDSAGNIYAAGSYQDSATFSGMKLPPNPGYHAFLAKYSKDGSLIWIRSTSGLSNSSQPKGLVLGPDNFLYMTGNFYGTIVFDHILITSNGNNDAFLVKYDLDGNAKWARSGGGNDNDFGKSVAIDPNGNIYMTGSFISAAKFGTTNIISKGDYDIFLAKYDPQGTLLWIKNFGSVLEDVGYGVACGKSGDVTITGTFRDTADFGGRKLYSKGRVDIFIAQYTTDGDLKWVQQAGDTAYGDLPSVVMDNAENVYVTGRFYFDTPGVVPDCDGIGNIYIAKYNKTGVRQWMKCAGNGGEESGNAIAVDSSGYVYVAGGYDFTVDFGSGKILNSGLIDAFIVKLNSDGIAQWADRAGGKGDDFGTSLALDRIGNIFLGGAFSDTCVFGSFTMMSQHLKDAFIAKIGAQASVKEISPPTSHFLVYPNPTQSAITIESSNDAKNSDMTVEFTNVLGVTLKKNILVNQSAFSLPIKDLPRGMYFCRVTTIAWSESRMVVVQ